MIGINQLRWSLGEAPRRSTSSLGAGVADLQNVAARYLCAQFSQA